MTELDYCVLGVIQREGPVTAYRVRSHFAASLTSAWSASSGSIYPAIRRLEKAGLVRATAARDGRQTRGLSVTAAGMKALRTWLENVTEDMSGPTWDPIRTRVQFVDVLNDRAAAALLDRMVSEGRASLRRIEKLAAALEDDPEHRLEYLGLAGGLHEVQGRLAWLDEVRRRLARK
jgi:DNA-binding PadR family transcriptional regulator